MPESNYGGSGELRTMTPPQGGLPRDVYFLVLILRLGARVLGFDFTVRAWNVLASELALPLASQIARIVGGGSFAAAKFLADVGPPVAERKPGFRGSRIKWRDDEDILSGALLAVRLNGGSWPRVDDWDTLIARLRSQGVRVPYLNQLYRHLDRSWPEIRQLAEALARRKRWLQPRLDHATPARLAEVIERMAFAERELGWRPPSHKWNNATLHLREDGVPVLSCITRYLRWLEAWQRVDELRLEQGRG